MKGSFARWRANFYTGLAIILPAIISIAIFKWLFGTVSGITDTPLFFLKYLPFLDKRWVYVNGQSGQMHWYWSLVALLLAVLLIGLLGRSARHFIGRKFIELMDKLFLRVPLLNKIYGAIKQVNEAFTSTKKSSFQQVVLVEFPRAGVYSVGFITGDQHAEVQEKTRERVVSVFVPTTPNPTTGFLILVSEDKLTKLDMSVADGIKFIISLGAVSPAYLHAGSPAPAAVAARLPEPPAHAASEPTPVL
jgi:uncharacterized membrane protein